MNVSDRQALDAHIDAIERAYEFMLAYAAQGLAADAGAAAGGELRTLLGAAVAALDALPAALREAAPAGAEFAAFRTVVEQDAARAAAAARLVLVQPAISSQLVDNLNASIHLRTLLTDLFLIDEILRPAAH